MIGRTVVMVALPALVVAGSAAADGDPASDVLYVGPLLVAMPAGLGIYDGGRSTAAEERVLARLAAHATGADRSAQQCAPLRLH